MDKQVGKNTKVIQALKHAIDGIVFAFKQERNLKIHTLATIIVILLAVVLQCNLIEWLWLVLCVSLVFIMEFINTIVEELVDIMTQKQYVEWAKHVKDLAAATVVIAALFALVVGGIIFIPKLIH